MKVIIPALIFAVLLIPDTIAAKAKIVVPKDAATIQKAIDKAQRDDTVFVLKGNYQERIMLREYVIVMGQDKEKTTLRGNRNGPVVTAVNYSTIKNFTIEKGETGILCENTNTVIEQCTIRENKTGIHCLVSLPEIRNNAIYRNKWSGIFCELVSYGENTSIEHNVIAENGYSGLVLTRRSSVLVQNNIFYGNKQFGIFVDIDSKRSRIIYNNFYGNRKSFNHYAVIDQSNISADPQFPEQKMGTYALTAEVSAKLKGAGKDGKDIGLMSAADLKRIFIDSDNDRIPDQDDKCNDLKEDLDEFEDWDGCPDYDNDLDGIYDAEDKCPHKAEDYDNFTDQDGCPDADNDRDGICDPWVVENNRQAKYVHLCTGSDTCPQRAETANGFQDSDGCPDEKPEENTGNDSDAK
ncbi:MAG: hypothetical protein GF398_15055 [Chitinivibrionales bacterium]|nr:hypothetical protein [Chitinivibrionales bacterium]